MSIEEIEKEIIEEFEMFDAWDDKYQHILDMGKELKPLPENLKTDDRLIRGCQNKLWLLSELKEGKVFYSADSDAIITKGIVRLLIRVLSDQTPDEIINAKLEFIDKIDLKNHFSMTRANGLVSMIKQMKLDALALKSKLA